MPRLTIVVRLHLSETAIFSCNDAVAGFSVTELVCGILLTMTNRNQLMDRAPLLLSNNTGGPSIKGRGNQKLYWIKFGVFTHSFGIFGWFAFFFTLTVTNLNYSKSPNCHVSHVT